MRTILITGAAGFLGSNLVRFCRKKAEYKIIAADIRKENIPVGLNIEVLTNEELFLKESVSADTVINCAFARGNVTANLVSALDFNEKLIEFLKKQHISSIINISSQGVYKGANPGEYVDENGKIEPFDMYAFAKYAQEKMFSSVFECSVTNIRMASLSSNARFLSAFVDSVVSGRDIVVTAPNQYVSMIDVRDAVAGIISVCELSPDKRQPVYNLGIGKQYSILEVANIVNEIGAKNGCSKVKVVNQDNGKTFAIGMDCSKLESATGWKPHIEINEMIEGLFSERINIKMLEADRIMQSGLLPKNYFVTEEKCGFLITEKRKRLFAVLLEMIKEFDTVCKKHHLTYFTVFGSLLGAVRHKGFIPWDDDFDVAMPREDYEKFIKLSDDFHVPLFLQTPYTDNGYYYTPTRIRNTNTCAVIERFKYAGFNQGIWLSVFPLDHWDDIGGKERYAEINKLVLHNSTYMRINNPNLCQKDIARVDEWKIQHRNPMNDYEEIQRLASSCDNKNSKYVMVAVLTMAGYDKKLLNAADFAEAIPMEFEGVSIMAPIGYDHLLKTWYGDYMQFPPMDERGTDHAGTNFDPDISYKDYLAKEGIIL